MELCRGDMTERKNAPKCPRRLECGRNKALRDWLATQSDFAPELPDGWTIAHRLCQTTGFERFQRCEASEP